MRVISGTAKGRQLKMVPGEGTRPITDRVKEAVFNILTHEVLDSRFLDLFAGTGAVGIEALSRGAVHATFVEKAAQAVRVVRENLRATGLAGRATVVHDDAFEFLRKTDEQFDIIYIAPPQYLGLWARALHALDERPILADDGVIVVQIFPKEFEASAFEHYLLTDQRTYGSTMLCFYRYGEKG